MIVFTSSDGPSFMANSYLGVVRKMAKLNWHRDEPKRTYMEDVLDRVEQITGVPFNGKLEAWRFLRYLHDQNMGKLRVTH